MEKPTVRRSTLALVMDSLIVYITYVLIGIIGYLSFASSPELKSEILTAQNIFKTTDYAQWIPNKIYSLLFLSTTLTLILSCLFPIKMVILECFKHKNTQSCKWNFIAALILCLVLSGFSLAINKTSMAIRAIGVTCYPTMCFVLPSLFYLSIDLGRKNWRQKVIKVLAWLLLLFVLGFIVSGVLDMVASSNQ